MSYSMRTHLLLIGLLSHSTQPLMASEIPRIPNDQFLSRATIACGAIHERSGLAIIKDVIATGKLDNIALQHCINHAANESRYSALRSTYFSAPISDRKFRELAAPYHSELYIQVDNSSIVTKLHQNIEVPTNNRSTSDSEIVKGYRLLPSPE